MTNPEDTLIYKNGSPLLRLLVETLVSARMDDMDEDGIIICSDSNGGLNVIELASKIEAMYRTPAVLE